MNGLRVIAVSFGKEDRGQDVAEYCMITALIVLVAFAIFWHFSGGLQGMWTSANTSLATGNSVNTTTSDGVSGH